MRKFILAAALGAAVPVMGVTVAGCNSTWWNNFENNPVATVQAFEEGVQIVLNDAAIAWTVVQPFIPASALPAVTQQYNNAVFAVNHAMQVLQDAVQAAVVAQQSNPNFASIMADVTNAVAAVLAVIQQYQNNPPPAPAVDGGASVVRAAPANPALAEAMANLAKLKTRYVH